ncbi:LPXTG cell wall anchor domain-containing protein, partial [Corynebacterium aurimucosum]|nr:LPXTG cell wall anchor domain-containing protein [Corynebacterium aurimucosum]
ATDGQEADPSKGVYNLVTMDGDLDEPGVVNNDECVTVTKHDEPPVSSTTSSVPSSTTTPVVPPVSSTTSSVPSSTTTPVVPPVSSTTAPAPSLTTTPAVPSAVPTPEPAPEEPARGPLAQTGANIKEMIAIGVLLALVGLMLVVRRRRED